MYLIMWMGVHCYDTTHASGTKGLLFLAAVHNTAIFIHMSKFVYAMCKSMYTMLAMKHVWGPLYIFYLPPIPHTCADTNYPVRPMTVWAKVTDQLIACGPAPCRLHLHLHCRQCEQATAWESYQDSTRYSMSHAQ